MPNITAGNVIVDSAQILDGIIVNADISASASIADSKLAQITTAGKVHGSAITGLASLPAGAGVIPNANLPTQAATLLKANSGTSTNTSANNLDTVDISGLSALDSLLIVVSYDAITAAGGAVSIRHSTDGIDLVQFQNTNPCSLGNCFAGEAIIQAAQNDNTTLNANWKGINGQGGAPRANTNVAAEVRFRSNGATTAFTGSWTLALRGSGVTATGTLRWKWAVYKLAGA